MRTSHHSIGCQWMRQRLRLPLYPTQHGKYRTCFSRPYAPPGRIYLSLHNHSAAHPLCSTCRCCNLEHSASPHNYCPSRFNPSKMLIIAFPASVSTFPAGSSPITIPESFENALGIATRWCCPLLNSAGLWYLRLPSPTFTSSSAAFSNLTSRSTPAKKRGSAHFLLTYGRD